jgi:hypothetical protein
MRRLTSGTSTSSRLEWTLFLTVWFAYGLAINSANLNAFGLQQAGVEAYVERHHFYLEGSQVEQLHVQPVIDAFLFHDHIYPAKQPGQFMAGACVYSVLRWFGLSYSGNFLLSAALVTFFTASLVTAGSAIAVCRMARLLAADGNELFWPVLATLCYALATTVLAYSGLAWHDTLATGYLTVAMYLLLRLPNESRGGEAARLAASAGCLLGLTISTSMLPSLMVVILILVFLRLRRWQLLPAFLGGGLLSLAPLLIYNSICFGNPFLLSNVVGGYRDTWLRFDWANLWSKLFFYARMLTLYVPVFWAGLLGLALCFPKKRRESLILFGSLLALAVCVLNIQANGNCQYGPRYLLPAMPIASVGLVGYSYLNPSGRRRAVTLVVAAAALLSFGINLLGALHGAMLCDFPEWPVNRYLTEMRNGPIATYPLARWLLFPFLISAVLLVRELMRPRERAACHSRLCDS